MTLNLMLTSRDAVYLSGDFRLVSVDDQVPLPDNYDTQKLIPVIRDRWIALVAYMGIASAPPIVPDMGQWIVEQLDAIPAAGELSELPARLLRFNHLLDRLRGDRRVAFSVVGFGHGRPFMMVISNFINLEGQVTHAGARLSASVRTPRQPEVRAVGTVRPDVFERVRLVRMLQANASRGPVPGMIRQAVADINASVARRSGGSISEPCVTGYLLRSGAATVGAHGVPNDAACFPAWPRRDLERGGLVGFAANGDGDSRLPMQWRGTTARVANGTILRTHEIANAGMPIFDRVDRERPPTWTSARGNTRNTVAVTFYSAL